MKFHQQIQCSFYSLLARQLPLTRSEKTEPIWDYEERGTLKSIVEIYNLGGKVTPPGAICPKAPKADTWTSKWQDRNKKIKNSNWSSSCLPRGGTQRLNVTWHGSNHTQNLNSLHTHDRLHPRPPVTHQLLQHILRSPAHSGLVGGHCLVKCSDNKDKHRHIDGHLNDTRRATGGVFVLFFQVDQSSFISAHWRCRMKDRCTSHRRPHEE